MKKLVLIPLALAAFSLSACETMNNQTGWNINKQQVGAVSGAVVGGILGSKVGDGNGKSGRRINRHKVAGQLPFDNALCSQHHSDGDHTHRNREDH